MGKDTKIEWCDDTVNLWWGCSKVHAGCKNCYAENLSEKRFQKGLWGNHNPREAKPKAFTQLRKLNKLNENRRVFVGSMMDIFEDPMPLVQSKFVEDNHWEHTGHIRDEFFAMVDHYTNLEFLLLTKRPGNINEYIPKDWLTTPPPNVRYGCSPVDQATYDQFKNEMSKVYGHKFYSIEPQLGPISLDPEDEVGWIIQGGESGPNKRPFDLKWAEDMNNQCLMYDIPYFFKQIDKVQPIPKHMECRQFPS